MSCIVRARSIRELVTFFAVGSTSAAAYIVLNVGFTRLFGLRPAFAIALTLAMLVPPTYLGQRRFTFASAAAHRHAFPRYIGTQLIANGMAMIGSEALSHAVKAAPWIAFTVVAGCVAAISYALQRFWTFRHGGQAEIDARA